MLPRRLLGVLCVCSCICLPHQLSAEPTRASTTYQRFKAYLDTVPAIDTHDHLVPFNQLINDPKSPGPRAMNLFSLWKHSYYTWYNPLAGRGRGVSFDEWWPKARGNFANARATSFYRFLLPAFQDLYGVDFDQITDAQAAEVDRKIIENYHDQRWLYHVITERANIELMIIDTYWAALEAKTEYLFAVAALNVNGLFRGFHPSEYGNPGEDPYRFAKEHSLRVDSLDDYVAVIDRIIAGAKQRGVPCLKNTLAYKRTLEFRSVPKERAEKVFGKLRKELSPEEVRDFEDYLMWRIVELAAQHDMPIQIHTGQARIQGSNPMLLVDLIEANPKTKFVLFHGGFPWVGETGVIVMRQASHVWVDSVWLPTLSYTMAKRAFHEWLEVMPSDRILWGADCNHAEGTYGAAEFTRMCLAEVLAEKVEAGDLLEEHAMTIGRRVMRENALKLFPGLKDKLWKHKGRLTPPSETASLPSR